VPHPCRRCLATGWDPAHLVDVAPQFHLGRRVPHPCRRCLATGWDPAHLGTSPLSSTWAAGTLFGISRLFPPAAHADRAPHTHRRGNLKTLSRKISHPTHSIGNPDQNSPPQSSIMETVGKFNGSSQAVPPSKREEPGHASGLSLLFTGF
jgi:hypothetical protein